LTAQAVLSNGSWTYTLAMGKLDNERETEGPGSLSDVRGTLNKSVMALAIQPLTMPLTLTGRKVYDVMLHIAQTSQAGEDGGWSYPVAGIMHGYGSRTKASERVQRYIELMVQTVVVFRPLAQSESSMSLEGFEASTGKTADEARTFALLSEARLYRRGRDWWVTWYFPPTIREHLLNPERWAQIELTSVAKLSTYTGLALYEITARYKDSPGGLTSRHPPEFWIDVLREGGELKKREWRKFKNELLMPAIAEIGEVTELKVELIEHRAHGAVDAVQFKVARKPKVVPAGFETVDVTKVIQAQRLGIREQDLDTLVAKYGPTKVADGLTAMDSYVTNSKQNVQNRLAYLKAVLNNKSKDTEPKNEQLLSPVELAFVPSENLEVRARTEVEKDWRDLRMKTLKLEFSNLSKEQRDDWVIKATPSILEQGFMTPNLRRRVDAKEWESPLISRFVLATYAEATHGVNWNTPSEMDLTLFDVDRSRERERLIT
jgi:hypothetical protein